MQRDTNLTHSRLRAPLAAAALAFGLLLGGCESTDETDEGPEGNVLLQDEHNYSSEGALTIPTVETASATDLDICWEGAIDDIQCHGLDPQDDVDNIALLRFLHLSETDVEEKLVAGQVDAAEVAGYLDYHTENASTCTKLSSMSFQGTDIEVEEEYVEDDDLTYLLLATEGTTPGVGARTMTFIKPRNAGTNTDVQIATGCGLLEFSANLSALEEVKIPAAGPWVVDWRNISADSQGNDIVFENIDGILLGFYEGMTVAELEAQIFDIELIATELYEITLSSGGKKADLKGATQRGENIVFKGFERDAEGIWLLGLMCSTCQNPAPLVLTILDPS